MQIGGKSYQTVWWKEGSEGVLQVIDQRHLPHRLVIEDLETAAEARTAIAEMHVRGAPLIGAVGAGGVYLAARAVAAGPERGEPMPHVRAEADRLKSARPTAVNLGWAVDRTAARCEQVLREAGPTGAAARMVAAARAEVDAIIGEELDRCAQIGRHGSNVLRDLAPPDRPLQLLTHCNAGWLACIDFGTATAPMYRLFDEGVSLHVWVDETRPRNQGARLTAWELGQHGVAHTVIADNAAGLLMRQGRVDAVIVGTDRTTRSGDVVNKIGTYERALAARDNDIPFYVALPSSSLDTGIDAGDDVPIEERDPSEVHWISGADGSDVRSVRVTPQDSPAYNPAFDVTPARLVTALITERGVCAPREADLAALFPERYADFDQPAPVPDRRTS